MVRLEEDLAVGDRDHRRRDLATNAFVDELRRATQAQLARPQSDASVLGPTPSALYGRSGCGGGAAARRSVAGLRPSSASSSRSPPRPPWPPTHRNPPSAAPPSPPAAGRRRSSPCPPSGATR